MWPRSVPVIRPRPPRFLGLHADAGPSRGRRTSDDAAGAAALPGPWLAHLGRNPFRAARTGGGPSAPGETKPPAETEPSLSPPNPPTPPPRRRPAPPLHPH